MNQNVSWSWIKCKITNFLKYAGISKETQRQTICIQNIKTLGEILNITQWKDLMMSQKYLNLLLWASSLFVKKCLQAFKHNEIEKSVYDWSHINKSGQGYK